MVLVSDNLVVNCLDLLTPSAMQYDGRSGRMLTLGAKNELVLE